MVKEPAVNPLLRQLSRRAFLAGLSVALFGSKGLGSALEVEESLEQFRDLSAVLTGFEPAELDLDLARIYRDAIVEMEPTALHRLIQSAGRVPSLQGLESSGAFEEPELKYLAHRVIEIWYTGIYPTGRGSRVGGYRHTLLWKTLDFAHPPTYCGPPWWT